MREINFFNKKNNIVGVLNTFEESELISLAPLMAKADIIEFRGDYCNRNEILKKLKILKNIYPKKILFTYRTKAEAGKGSLNLKDYIKLNKIIDESGLVDLIDLEYKALLKLNESTDDFKAQIIISYHNFNGVEDELDYILKDMANFKADLYKIAVMVNNKAELKKLIEITKALPENKTIIAMGDIGRKIRLKGELIGNRLSYFSLGESVAPGMVSLEEIIT